MTKKIQLNFAIFVLAFIILGSILAPLLAVTLGKLKVEGNIDKALYLKKLIDSRKAEQNAIKKTQKQK